MGFTYKATELSEITSGIWYPSIPNTLFDKLETDSRNIQVYDDFLFIAIVGKHFDGHDFCKNLALKGQKYFMTSRKLDLPEGCFQHIVHDTIVGLQQIAAAYRSSFSGTVVGITGSNGKTIVKEWLYELISSQFRVYKSPKSYNSQIGVPLSILQAPVNADYYLLEAGISQKNEMQALEKMIKPEWGIFTHLGIAHNDGFDNMRDKLSEKLQLFQRVNICFFHDDLQEKEWLYQKINGQKRGVKYQYVKQTDGMNITVESPTNNTITIHTRFKEEQSIRNFALCIATALEMGIPERTIQMKALHIKALPMRMELMDGLYNSSIINDTWTNDPEALIHSMSFLMAQKKQKEAGIILSDFEPNAPPSYYSKSIEYIHRLKPHFFVGIGKEWKKLEQSIHVPEKLFFAHTSDAIRHLNQDIIRNKAILIKGGRNYTLEKLAEAFCEKKYLTRLEIHLDHLSENFHTLKNRLPTEVKIMAMVKAFAYGSGNYEAAKILSHNLVDYFAVANIDEGIALREAGIIQPILILNPDIQNISDIINYDLEIAIGTVKQLLQLAKQQIPIRIHLELDTGMHRLGVYESELSEVQELLKKNNHIQVKGIFTHLAASEEPDKDPLTAKQLNKFHKWSNELTAVLKYKPMIHISNTAAMVRNKELHADMVRIGIGLYGINPTNVSLPLKNVFKFVTHITQIKEIAPNEGVGYGFHDPSSHRRKIAILSVGYADGFKRGLGRGKLSVYVKGILAPTVGNICMDMCMIDVTNILCEEGDEVELMGENVRVEEWAKVLNTIPYEILTSISQRVKRIFLSEK
jgi:Alr-MurF fusion protein